MQRADYLWPTLDIRKIKCRSQTLSQLLGVVVGPEVHEEQMRRIINHVAVKSCDFDAVLSKRLEYRIYFTAEENEVAGSRRFAVLRRLKIDCDGRAHRR